MAARTPMTIDQLPLSVIATPLVDLAALHTFDNANGMTFPVDGVTHLVVQNPTGGALTLTVFSANDPYNRVEDITAYSIAAGHFVLTCDFPTVGWNSGGGNICNVDASGALHYAAVRRAPGT